MKDSLDYYVPIKSEDVHFWCPFFEAFEGMLVLRTPEPAKGKNESLLHMMVSADYKDEYERLLSKYKLKPSPSNSLSQRARENRDGNPSPSGRGEQKG